MPVTSSHCYVAMLICIHSADCYTPILEELKSAADDAVTADHQYDKRAFLTPL